MKKSNRRLPNPMPTKELQDRMRDLARDGSRDYFDLFDRRLRDYLDIMRDYQDEMWDDDDDKESSDKKKKES